MSHPGFYEHAYKFVHLASQAGLQGAASPLPGLQGCPLLHLLSSRAAAGGAQKKKKEFCGDTPHPGRDAALPAPSLLRIFVSKIRDDSC